ncbi:MAG: hypothetical protein HY843_00725, partial [Bdellovibrio sp.]|nr:hypothetical protein [Bdellovibrio sp.]
FHEQKTLLRLFRVLLYSNRLEPSLLSLAPSGAKNPLQDGEGFLRQLLKEFKETVENNPEMKSFLEKMSEFMQKNNEMQEKLEKLALLSPISNNDQGNSKEIS